MYKLKSKPETASFSLCGYELFKINGKWHTLHKNGGGFYALLLDGRSVYSTAKKVGKLEEYKNFKNLEIIT